MKIYDRIEGRNCIEVLPPNKSELLVIQYGHNKNKVHLNVGEVGALITFLTKHRDSMPLRGSDVKDAITKT